MSGRTACMQCDFDDGEEYDGEWNGKESHSNGNDDSDGLNFFGKSLSKISMVTMVMVMLVMVMMVMVMVMTVRAVGTGAGMMREAVGEEVTSGEDDKWQEDLKAENSPSHHGRWTFQSKWYKSPTGKMVRDAQTGKTNPGKWLKFVLTAPLKTLFCHPGKISASRGILQCYIGNCTSFEDCRQGLELYLLLSKATIIFAKSCNGTNHSAPFPRNSDILWKGCK